MKVRGHGEAMSDTLPASTFDIDFSRSFGRHRGRSAVRRLRDVRSQKGGGANTKHTSFSLLFPFFIPAYSEIVSEVTP